MSALTLPDGYPVRRGPMLHWGTDYLTELSPGVWLIYTEPGGQPHLRQVAETRRNGDRSEFRLAESTKWYRSGIVYLKGIDTITFQIATLYRERDWMNAA